MLNLTDPLFPYTTICRSDCDIMKMRRLEAVEIPAHGSAVLRPGSHHLMLIGLKQPLHEGERFPPTLTFEKAGTITVEITVEGIASMGPHGGSDHGADHGGQHHGTDRKSTRLNSSH